MSYLYAAELYHKATLQLCWLWSYNKPLILVRRRRVYRDRIWHFRDNTIVQVLKKIFIIWNDREVFIIWKNHTVTYAFVCYAFDTSIIAIRTLVGNIVEAILSHAYEAYM